MNGNRTITLLISALGGEGGGVLSRWIVDAVESQDFYVQFTSIPGVAQRTGATNYYIEVFPEKVGDGAAPQPVFALTPTPGNLDAVIASEVTEAGRAIQNGFVTPGRTTLIASTHRIYSIAEKSAMGDGRYAGETIEAAAQPSRPLHSRSPCAPCLTT
jgi:indolepyruvate ferredoxin oxidoreductase beta subunit